MLDSLRDESSAVLAETARLILPYYGDGGSLDLDLRWYPHGDGPSYYNQMAHYPLLLLAYGVVPGASDRELESFRDRALRNIEYVLGITDPEYRTPHYSRGTDWGAHVGEWLNYFLLQSLRLLERRGDVEPTFLHRIRDVVHGTATAIHRSYQKRFPLGASRATFPGNHPAWYALYLAEAGAYFQEETWQAYARGFYETYVFPTQDRTGVWPEGGGIVVNYSTVTAIAVSLYADATGDARAHRALERALPVLRFFSFPDGTTSVVADCRVRYSERPQLPFPPGFLRHDEGVALCLQRVRTVRQRLSDESLPDNAGLGLAFFACLAHRLFAPGDLSEPPKTDTAHPVQTDPRDEHATSVVPVSRVEDTSWQGYLSGQLTPESRSRWHLDAQSFIEVWHRESGYIVGGGNSKYMPRFSTLRRTNRGRSYIPEEAQLVRGAATSATRQFRFGEDRLFVTIAIDGAQLVLRFRGEPSPADAAYEACLTLPVHPGEVLTLGDGSRLSVAPERSILHRFSEGEPELLWRGRRFTVPANAYLEYPLLPHNPYRQDTLPEPSGYVARLSLELGRETATIAIQ